MKKRVCKLDRDQGTGCCSIAAVSMAIKSGQELDIFHLEEGEREELMEGGGGGEETQPNIKYLKDEEKKPLIVRRNNDLQ